MVGNSFHPVPRIVSSTRVLAEVKKWEENGRGKVAHRFITMFRSPQWVANEHYFSGIAVLLKLYPTEAQLLSTHLVLRQRWEIFFKPMSIHVPFARYVMTAFSLLSLVVDPLTSFRYHLPVPLDRKILRVAYYIVRNADTTCFISHPDIGHSSCTQSLLIVFTSRLVTIWTLPKTLTQVFSRSTSRTSVVLWVILIHIITREGDIAQLILSYKFTHELTRRMLAYRGEVAALHPKFLVGSIAACKERDVPAFIDTPDIVCSDVDEETIVEFLRDSGESASSDLPPSICSLNPPMTTIVAGTIFHSVSHLIDHFFDCN